MTPGRFGRVKDLERAFIVDGFRALFTAFATGSGREDDAVRMLRGEERGQVAHGRRGLEGEQVRLGAG